MPSPSKAGQLVASLRDRLSRRKDIQPALERLRTASSAASVLPHNPPQPPSVQLPPLDPPLTTTRFDFADGSTAILQQETPSADRPNRPIRARIWVSKTKQHRR